MRISVRPKNFFKLFIQLPGFGKNETSEGKNPVKINGKDRPKPIDKKIVKIVKLSEVNAKVRAVPRKGAEQGVESIVAKTPPKKSPINGRSVLIWPICLPPGVENSKSPNKFNERIKRTIIMIAIKLGDCN